MRPGVWNLTLEEHRACFFVLPGLFHVEHRCENAECRELHGWSIELGWLWWSVSLERNYTGGEAI